MKPLSELLPLLDTPCRIFITCHTKPDGDAAGSTLGLAHYLRAMGHEATVVVPSELPDFLAWLPGADTVIDAEKKPESAARAVADADFIFCLDFNDLSRTKVLETLLAAASQPRVLIDHHMFPKPSFAYGLSVPEASSTCELVYDFICMAGHQDRISVEAATCLYTGLVTDTGSFRFPATAASTHRMAAHLKDLGLLHAPIHEAVSDSWSESRMRFIGYALIERMQIFPEHKAGLIAISRADLKLFGLTTGDTEGLVNYPLSIAGVCFATLITERPDEVKLSFRSKGDLDVNAFARTYFNGGGHFNASGGRSERGFNETVDYFISVLPHLAPLREQL